MKLYAAKLILHPSAMRRLRITDTYGLHRTVMDLMDPVRTDSELNASVSSGVQWVDKGERLYGREIQLLLNREPREQKFPDDVLFAFREIPENFFQSKQYRFALTANTVVVSKGKRIPLKKDDQRIEWMNRKADFSGFRLDALNIDARDVDVFEKDGKQLFYAKTLFSGILTVLDSDIFWNVFSVGIGKGRAFGCGMLQLVRI